MVRPAVSALFAKVKARKPLVHHITNAVTINDCANVTLAIGASPVMASSPEEAAHMVRLADALVMNIGTLDERACTAMLRAGQAANEQGIPVILDPVGAGATRYRTENALKLLRHVTVTAIRGNASEVHALLGGQSTTRGVDAGAAALSPLELALRAADAFKCVTVVSGTQDVVADGRTSVRIDNGDIWLTQVTGTGCMATSLIGCFAAVADDAFAAAVAGMSVMSVAGENAREKLREEDGIGTYKMKLMDTIFHMDAKVWKEEVRLIDT